MSMSSAQYNAYIKQIEMIVAQGTKEQLQALYAKIIAETGDWDNLHRLDSLHNRKWSMGV